MKNIKETILNKIEDMVSDFFWYDRKEDEELPRGKIEEVIKEGIVTIDELVEIFKKCVTNAIKPEQ